MHAPQAHFSCFRFYLWISSDILEICAILTMYAHRLFLSFNWHNFRRDSIISFFSFFSFTQISLCSIYSKLLFYNARNREWSLKFAKISEFDHKVISSLQYLLLIFQIIHLSFSKSIFSLFNLMQICNGMCRKRQPDKMPVYENAMSF